LLKTILVTAGVREGALPLLPIDVKIRSVPLPVLGSDPDCHSSKRYAIPRRTHASHPKDFPFLKGHIKDMSMGGMCLEVPAKNDAVIPHKAGESFHVDTVLPNGQDLSLKAEIVSAKKDRAIIRPGRKFRELPDYQESKRVLGFFLLPTS
jgi:hypothetical protein